MILYRLTVLLLLLMTPTCSYARSKNVIFIGLSSVGYSDFESHDPLMRTPHIKALRKSGVFLNQSYSFTHSQSTQSAWMTGRYPHTYGYQSLVRFNQVMWINENITFLPERFQNLSYTTHLVGGWGLGYCHPCLLPLERGFDTFYGSLLGSLHSRVNHTKTVGNNTVYDWWENDTLDYSAKGTYMTDLINARAVEVIKQSSPDKPFFLHLSYQMTKNPEEVPQKYRDLCPDVDVLKNTPRHTRCAIMAAIDKGVGDVVAAVKEKGIYYETVILLTSDAGGDVHQGGANFPLRGSKMSLYEGGIRSYTIFSDSSLHKTNIIFSGLVHAIDWVPTLIDAAAHQEIPKNDVHGVNQYYNIKSGAQRSKRLSFIIANDWEKFNHVMIRNKHFKLIKPLNEMKQGRIGNRNTGGWLEKTGNGTFVWKNVPENRGVFLKKSLLFDLNKEPLEKQLLPDTRKTTRKTKALLKLMTEYLGTAEKIGLYPIQPLQDPVVLTTDNIKDGKVSTAWCQPPGLPADTDTCSK